MLHTRLGESQTGVDNDAFRADAGGDHRVHLPHELVFHVGEYAMLVVRCVGVRRGPVRSGQPSTPMLHDIQAAMVGDDPRQILVQRSAGYVVDDLCAVFQRAGSHACTRGVDGQHRPCRNQRGNRPLDACQLIFRRYAFGARSGRFGTDVDDVRAGGHHGTPMFHGLIRLKPQAPVRKRVLGDVQHAHNLCAAGIADRFQIGHRILPVARSACRKRLSAANTSAPPRHCLCVPAAGPPSGASGSE